MSSTSTPMEIDTPPTPLFSPGLEQAALAISSGVLNHSWAKIFELRSDQARQICSPQVSVQYRVSEVENSKYRVIAFVASPVPNLTPQEGSELIPSSEIPDFNFLCSKSNPEFSISKAAKTLLDYARSDLSSLKSQVVEGSKTTPYLITGHYLGGTIASLFTLLLLDELNPTSTKRPLCVTFGSPLLGDSRFEQVMSHYSAWNSCFLHAVHRNDPFPGIFPATNYRPFGTFLFLSDSGKACFEAPKSISLLLDRMKAERGENQDPPEFDYAPTVDRLQRHVVCRDATALRQRETDPYKVGVIAQLAAIDFLQNEQQNNRGRDMNWVEMNIVEPEKRAFTEKRPMTDPVKKLSDVKVNMAHLEWYKKKSEDDGHAYYDSYKNKRQRRDHEVVRFTRILTEYWEREVEEVQKKPQKEKAHLRKRWLYGGNNFRRMVEPLYIADYYKVEGRTDYLARGRRNCFEKLEKWQEKWLDTRRQHIRSALTEDSCFWAHVEEAIIACKKSKDDISGSFDGLGEFEGYVMALIDKYTVSPEIFMEGSSFMNWWKDYNNLLPPGYDTKLTRFMRDGQYNEYRDGLYDPRTDDE